MRLPSLVMEEWLLFVTITLIVLHLPNSFCCCLFLFNLTWERELISLLSIVLVSLSWSWRFSMLICSTNLLPRTETLTFQFSRPSIRLIVTESYTMASILITVVVELDLIRRWDSHTNPNWEGFSSHIHLSTILIPIIDSVVFRFFCESWKKWSTHNNRLSCNTENNLFNSHI